jgi:hypothetical protein
MAKVKGIPEQQARIKRIIASALKASGALPDVEAMFKAQIRSGKLPDESAIKSLAKSTINRRSKLAKINSTHSDFSASTSNLTFSGQLIDSFKSIVTFAGSKLVLTLTPKGIHKGPNLIRGGRGKGTTNEKVADGQRKMGRDFTKVGPKFIKRVREIIEQALKKSIKSD